MRLAIFSILAAVLPLTAAVPARPGSVNYVEGKVSIDGKDVSSSAIGSSALYAGSVLRTGAGKAEVLLTPGVFLRVGSNSEVQLVSPGLTDTRVALNRGEAMLEASEVHDENRIRIAQPGLDTWVKKHGVYLFDADRNTVAVFDGKAEVRQNDQQVEVKKGKEAVAATGTLKAEKFDLDQAKKTDDLYQWSSVRSKYLSEATEATAQRVVVTPGLWYGSGWYWDPFWRSYTWLPSRPYFSPFGYGFYSPWAGPGPYYYGVPRYRVYSRPSVVVPRPAPVRPPMNIGRARGKF